MPPITRSQTAAAATQTRVKFILEQLQSFQDLFWAMMGEKADEASEQPPPVGDTDYFSGGGGGGSDDDSDDDADGVAAAAAVNGGDRSSGCCHGGIRWIDGKDEIGWDFRGPRRAFMLFFTGSSDYFVGIWVGDYVEAICAEPAGDVTTPSLLEKLPVLVFDLEKDDCCADGDGKSSGNLRSYLQEVVDWCRDHGAALGDEHNAEVDRLQAFVLGLSEHCINDRGGYPGKLSKRT